MEERKFPGTPISIPPLRIDPVDMEVSRVTIAIGIGQTNTINVYHSEIPKLLQDYFEAPEYVLNMNFNLFINRKEMVVALRTGSGKARRLFGKTLADDFPATQA